MVSERLELRLKADERIVMHQTVKHLRALAVLSLAVFLPVSAANGQYQRDFQPDYDVSDTRDQTYIRNVVSLSSTLGSAHAIRLLCNGRDDQYWRGYMQELLGVEAPYQSRLRSSMVSAFNEAYSAESARRSGCDQAAVSAEKVYATTGKRLADELAQANLPSRAYSGPAEQ